MEVRSGQAQAREHAWAGRLPFSFAGLYTCCMPAIIQPPRPLTGF
jgi:hypothetical protein